MRKLIITASLSLLSIAITDNVQAPALAVAMANLADETFELPTKTPPEKGLEASDAADKYPVSRAWNTAPGGLKRSYLWMLGTELDQHRGQATVQPTGPQLQLAFGFVYLRGKRPLAMTRHVLTASESTDYILWRDFPETNGTHFVFAKRGKVRVVVLLDDNPGLVVPDVDAAKGDRFQVVPPGYYVTVSLDTGQWKISEPKPTPTNEALPDEPGRIAKRFNHANSKINATIDPTGDTERQ